MNAFNKGTEYSIPPNLVPHHKHILSKPVHDPRAVHIRGRHETNSGVHLQKWRTCGWREDVRELILHGRVCERRQTRDVEAVGRQGQCRHRHAQVAAGELVREYRPEQM